MDDFDDGRRFDGDVLVAASDVRRLLDQGSLPRRVRLLELPDGDVRAVTVEHAEMVGEDPAGVVRCHLGTDATGSRLHIFGDSTVLVRGPLPARSCERPGSPQSPPVWGGGVWPPGEPELGGRRRRVKLLGGPQDGAEWDTTCSEIECLAEWSDGMQRWLPPADGGGTHVYYRVRRVAEMETSHPGLAHAVAGGWEWVATFEGPRDYAELRDRDETLRAWPERFGPAADDLLEGPQPGEHEHRRFRACHPGCPLYEQPVPDRDHWLKVSPGRKRVRELAAAEFRMALEAQEAAEELAARIRELRAEQQTYLERVGVHYEVLHADLRMSDGESRDALAYQAALDDDRDAVHLLRTVWLPKEYEAWEREQS